MSRARLAAGGFALFALASCDRGAPESQAPVRVAVHVTSDPGKGLAGADVTYAGKPIATTDDKGVAALELKGRQGDVYEVSVVCPVGYESPNKNLTITLRRLADPKEMPEYDVSCPKATRTIVVAVRADNGPGLPVLYLGREVARTDGSGAAHVLIENLPRDAQFDLTLDTHLAEQLRPRSPIASFTLKGQDDVFVMEQKFTVEAKQVVWKPGPKKPVGPVALPTKINP